MLFNQIVGCILVFGTLFAIVALAVYLTPYFDKRFNRRR